MRSAAFIDPNIKDERPEHTRNHSMIIGGADRRFCALDDQAALTVTGETNEE
jgi:hypothetical protein